MNNEKVIHRFAKNDRFSTFDMLSKGLFKRFGAL